jgi:hypothetical protein
MKDDEKKSPNSPSILEGVAEGQGSNIKLLP